MSTPRHSIKPRRYRLVPPLVVISMLLAGCAANGGRSDDYLATHGYWYHDGNHEGGSSGSASPQAKYNAIHGTWLWPPEDVDIPN
jgi:hypothetical protein